MDQFLLYHKRMFAIALAVSLGAAVALYLSLPGEPAYVHGFIVGAAAQLAKFGVLDVSTIRRIAADPGNAAKAQLRATALSLLVFALAVAVVFKFGLNVWAMAGGIFLPRILLLADTFIRPDPFANQAEEKDEPRDEINET